MSDQVLLYVMKTDTGYDFFSAAAEIDEATWDAALASVGIDTQPEFTYQVIDGVHVWSMEAK